MRTVISKAKMYSCPSLTIIKQSLPCVQGGPPPTDLAELVSLVSAQQSTLYSQQAEIKQVRQGDASISR